MKTKNLHNQLVEWQDARVHIISHGMHYASLVFEGLRVYNKKIFKLEDHTKRLFKSADIIGIKIPYSQEEINQAKDELIKITRETLKDCGLLGFRR